MMKKVLLGMATGALALTLITGAAAAARPTESTTSSVAAVQMQHATQQEGQKHRRGARVLVGSLIRNTAEISGMTPAEVVTELRAGKSLAQVAESKGKTADEVIAAARAKIKARLDQAVANGRITQEQADQMLQRFDEKAPEVMNNTELGSKLRRAGR
jgi:hypothetical protein